MQMRFQHIDPHPLLRDYIERMWIFESSGRIPIDDMKLVVPNGLLKLSVSYRNAIKCKSEGWSYSSKENTIDLTGLVDMPIILDTVQDITTGTIGIEFNPEGAYRFFHLKLSEIKNQIYPLTDILGKAAKQLEEKIANAESPDTKLFFLQRFLLKQFMQYEADPIFEYCVKKIKSTKGKTTVRDLEKKTGYTSRWLNMKFTDRLGISPKNLSSIIRFKQYYQALANNTEADFMQNDFYDYYYDQSHFLKDFKRFTGSLYKGFQNRTNEFGKIFYKA
jgi:Domain of unknown function (DUF6597)